MPRHIPVLLNEVIESLDLEPGEQVVDCTLGDGGHAEKILEKIAPGGKVLGIDADPESLIRAKQFLYSFGERVIFVRNNFKNLKKIISENDFKPSVILMDLGWSTPQFKERKKGFSFDLPGGEDEPLDMRYETEYRSQNTEVRVENSETNQTASGLLNNLSKENLEKIFREYGEEKFAKDIAEKIVEFRKNNKLETTGQLTELILQVYREKLGTEKEVPWVGKIHPATKVFQALRIAVNDELNILKQVLPEAISVLESGGRLAVISFHSLEDRIVKHYFQSIDGQLGKMINKKPIVASEPELKANQSSRSAKLRVFKKN